ncbi:MAG: hypothetical protein GX891_03465, partial [Clostridiales bacterium]|nr:hypothetical protein [Clostridiales bacterium]
EQLEKLKEESKKPSISLSKRDDKGIKTFMPEKDNVTAYEPIKKPPQFPVKKIEDRENALNKPVEGSFAIKPEAKKLDKYLDSDKTDKPAVKTEGLDFLLPKTPSEPKFTPPVTSAPKTEDSAGDYIFDGSDGFIDIKSPSAYKTLIEERREKLKERREQLKAKLEEQKARQISIDESIKQEETKEEKKVIQRRPYVAPPLSLLRPPEMNTGSVEDFEERKQAIEETFRYFGVESQVVETIAGPTFTLYKVKILEMPKSRPISWVTTFANDLEMRMEIEGVKILAPIPGEGTVGIEVANRRRSIVRLSEIIRSQEYNSAKSPTTFAIGKDVHGRNHVAEIKSLPHMLIAGQTGSGKSCCINSLIISLLYHASPEDLRLIMIDPKRTELSPYEGIPHLLLDEIICDIDKAIKALQWCIKEMDRRNEILSSKGYRDIDEYNAGESNSGAEKMYRILIIIDELADLMMLGKKLVEESINRLARLARATGIHLVVATQRPSVDVISGTIKNNLPTRIAFKVPSGADSRTVLDSVGAEDLLGDGDLLYKHVKAPIPIRLQGAFIGGEEVRDVVEFIKSHNESYFDDRIKEEIFSEPESESVSSNSQGKKGGRALSPEFFEVLRMGMDGTLISVSMIQRKLRVGYPKAGAIYDQLDSMKLLGEPDKSNKGRPVIITKEQYDALL